MVRFGYLTRFMAVLASLFFAIGAHADGILEKMQDEVATISSKARSAVVTIEDGRLLLGSRMEIGSRFAEAFASSNEIYRLVSTVGPSPGQQAGTFFSGQKANLFIPDQRPDALSQSSQPQAPATETKPDASPLQPGQTPVLGAIAGIGQLFRNKPQQGFGFSTALAASQTPKSGSGFSIGDGYIVTTADVLEGMQNPVVITDTGTRVKSTIIGIDSELNIGLLRLAAKVDLPALPLGKSSAVRVGHFALSIANQAGQPNSVALMLIGNLKTEGTSAGNRFYPSLIQIAGTIGAGASGAPLLNVRGEVIGIIAGTPAGDESQFYVNPAAPVSRVLPRRTAPRATDPAKPLLPKRTSSTTSKNRVTVTYSVPATTVNVGTANPSFTLGQQGNALALGTSGAATPLIVNGNTIVLSNDGGATALKSSDNDSRTLYQTAYLNGYAASTLRPVITSAGLAIPIDDILPIIDDMRAGKRQVHVWLGVDLKDVVKNVEQGGIVRMDPSVQINQIFAGSPAHKEGLLPGDVLISLNGAPVSTGNEVKTHLTRLRPGDALTVVYKRGETTHTLEIRMEPRPTVIPQVVPSPGR